MAHETTVETANAWYDAAFELLMKDGNFAIFAMAMLVALAILAFLIHTMVNSSRDVNYRQSEDKDGAKTTEFSSGNRGTDGPDNTDAANTPAE